MPLDTLFKYDVLLLPRYCIYNCVHPLVEVYRLLHNVFLYPIHHILGWSGMSDKYLFNHKSIILDNLNWEILVRKLIAELIFNILILDSHY